MRLPVVALFVVTIGACTSGEHPFLQVQLCLRDEQGVSEFKARLRLIADRTQSRYIEGSESTRESLKIIGATGEHMHTDGGLINIGVERADGTGLGAGNMGLNRYEVAIGFSPDTPASRQFADLVTRDLGTKWTLVTVPRGTGSFPDPKCAYN